MKKTNKTPFATSFHGTTFKASPSDLRKILDVPRYDGNDGEDKTNFDWVLETNSGKVFTVYDWKEYRVLEEDEIVEWHIGGKSVSETEEALREIEEALSKI